MKRLLAGTCLALAGALTAAAQASSATNQEPPPAPSIRFSETSGAPIHLLQTIQLKQNLLGSEDAYAAQFTDTPQASATVSTGDPSPAPPEPRFVFGGRDDFRWQLGIGVAWNRFRSSIFNASAVGVNSSIGYFTNDWFALEGNVGATFAPQIFQNEHVKLILYGVGPKIAWRQRKWEPWLHGLVGGIHEQPQTQGNSKNALALQLGGGADYRWRPRMAFRLEADYVRSSLFSEHQDNFQLIGGVVFHF